MRALVLTDYGRLELLDVPCPAPGPREVLVRVMACGICGSDVHGLDGSTGRRRPPLVMGHEAAGVVEEAAREAAGFAPGERVTFDSTIYDPDSWFSRRGQFNLCDGRRVLGVSCEDYRRDGAFAELVAVPQHILHRLPAAVSFEQAALVEPAAVALHALKLTPLAEGETALVVGVGPIGLMALQLLRLRPLARVVVADVDPGRLELARRLGAEPALDAREADVAEALRALTGGRGADAVFEAVGLPATVASALGAVRKGGCVTLVGNLAPEVPLPLQAVVTRQLRLQGSCASSGEYPECLELMAEGRIAVDRLLSASAPLEEGPSWFRRLRDKEPGLLKVVLRPNG